jgi:hypothetical protein
MLRLKLFLRCRARVSTITAEDDGQVTAALRFRDDDAKMVGG